MSGFEIVGVVFGALPLILASFEGYQNTRNKARTWFRFRMELEQLKDDLALQQHTFELSLEELLLPMIFEPSEIASLLAQPGGDPWKKPETEEVLVAKLGRSYGPYMGIMRAMKEVVVSLQHDLGLDSLEDNPKDPKQRLKFEAFRAKFAAGIGKSAVRELLVDLQRRNAELRTLLEQVEKVTRLSQTHQTASATCVASSQSKALCSFWKPASALFRVLQAAWASCSCSKQHSSSIVLRHPEAVLENAEFEVVISTSAQPSVCQQRKLLITAGRDEKGPETVLFVPSAVATAPTAKMTGRQPSLQTASRPRSAMKKGSHIANGAPGVMSPPPTPPLQATTTVQLQASTIQAPSAVRPNIRKPTFSASVTTVVGSTTPAAPDSQKITDLCKVLSCTTTSDDGCCVGFLHDEDSGRDDRYYVFPQSSKTATGSHRRRNFISLEDIIEHREGRPRLPWRRRLFLSMTLASSFLQLLDSPWIPHLWTEADIVFFASPEDPNEYLLDEPRVGGGEAAAAGGQGLPAVPGPSSTTPTITYAQTTGDKRHDSLCRLGIVLMQLCFGEPIRTWRERTESTPAPEPNRRTRLNADFMAARRWRAHDGEEPAFVAFRDCVKWCMDDYRDSAAVSTRQDGWRHAMLANVVEPLEVTYRQLESHVLS